MTIQHNIVSSVTQVKKYHSIVLVTTVLISKIQPASFKVSLRYNLFNVDLRVLVSFINPLGITYLYFKKIIYSLET